MKPETEGAAETRQGEDYVASFTAPPADAPHANEVRASILEQIEHFAKEYSGAGLEGVARLEVETTSHESEDFLTYVVSSTEDVGGASAPTKVRSFVYDRKTGRAQRLSVLPSRLGLIEKDRDVRLPLLTWSPPSEECGDIQAAGVEAHADAAYVTDDALVFLFSSYKVGPGGCGVLKVELKRKAPEAWRSGDVHPLCIRSLLESRMGEPRTCDARV